MLAECLARRREAKAEATKHEKLAAEAVQEFENLKPEEELTLKQMKVPSSLKRGISIIDPMRKH